MLFGINISLLMLTDPLAWVLFTKGCIAIVITILLIKRPVRCGWSKRAFYYIISISFFSEAISSFDRLIARNSAVIHETGALIAANRLIVTDTISLLALIFVLIALGITHYKCVEREQIDEGKP